MSLRKFLGILFMCHQRADRSFHIRGWQFPLCARCTGIFFGIFIGISIAILTKANGYLWYLLCLVPMLLDGGIQQFTKYESGNLRRLITGLLGGVGIVYHFITYHHFAVWLSKMILY